MVIVALTLLLSLGKVFFKQWPDPSRRLHLRGIFLRVAAFIAKLSYLSKYMLKIRDHKSLCR